MSKKISSVTAVTVFVTGFYLAFTAIALGMHGWNPLWFVWIGEKFANLTTGGTTGYDGQFIYYIARYGSAAIPHLDNPAYRLQRILFPAAVRLVSWGNPGLASWAMIVINFIAIVLTTYLLAKWLSKQQLSPWYALMYSLYIGTFLAYSRDLTEPLAFCLVIMGVILWLEGSYTHAAIFLAMAPLAKEITLLFVFGIIASSLFQKKIKLAVLAFMTILPFVLWQGYLFMKLGAIPMIVGPALEHIPLNGILPHLTLAPGRISSFLFVGLPGFVLLCVAIIFLFRGNEQSPAMWWLLLNSLFVILMPFGVYDHIMASGRNATGLILSLLFLLPLLRRPVRIAGLVYWTFPTLIWILPVLRWVPNS